MALTHPLRTEGSRARWDVVPHIRSWATGDISAVSHPTTGHTACAAATHHSVPAAHTHPTHHLSTHHSAAHSAPASVAPHSAPASHTHPAPHHPHASSTTRHHPHACPTTTTHHTHATGHTAHAHHGVHASPTGSSHTAPIALALIRTCELVHSLVECGELRRVKGCTSAAAAAAATATATATEVVVPIRLSVVAVVVAFNRSLSDTRLRLLDFDL
jgi:hypothetical protein